MLKKCQISFHSLSMGVEVRKAQRYADEAAGVLSFWVRDYGLQIASVTVSLTEGRACIANHCNAHSPFLFLLSILFGPSCDDQLEVLVRIPWLALISCPMIISAEEGARFKSEVM